MAGGPADLLMRRKVEGACGFIRPLFPPSPLHDFHLVCLGSAGKGVAHLPPANGVAAGWEVASDPRVVLGNLSLPGCWLGLLLQGLVPVCRSAGVGLLCR